MYLHEIIVRSGYEPNLIVAVARGGWIPARLLLDFRSTKDVANIKIEGYTEINQQQVDPIISQPLGISVEGKTLLVVDDIADSGKSLKLAIEHLKEAGAAVVKTATLYHKPWSIVTPDYLVRQTDVWVVFPWEFIEFSRKQHELMSKEGKNSREIADFLKSVGIPASVVESYFAWDRKGFP